MLLITVIIVIIIILLLIVISCMYFPSWDVYNYHMFHKMVRLYGPPTFVDPYKKGVSIWKFDKNNINYIKHPFKRIMMIDTKEDPLYITITYDIDSKKICDILLLDKSIIYDRTLNELTIRGQHIYTILSLFVYIDKFNNDIVKKQELKYYLTTSKKNMKINYDHMVGVKKTNLIKLIET